MSHHRTAALTILVTLALDTAAAVTFAHLAGLPILPPARGPGGGLYWSVTTMMTVGYGDLVPRTRPEYWLAIWTMLSVIPLGAASISFFTSGLTAGHVRRAEVGIKKHVEDRLEHHLGGGDRM